MRYEPIYPKIVEFARKQIDGKREHMGSVIYFLKKYPEKDESLKLLDKIARTEQKGIYGYKSDAEDAIKEIKEWKNKNKKD